MSNWPEADILHNVWPFAYRASKDREIQACLGELCSVAVALGKNKDRSLEAKEKRPRKAMGAKVDILFKVSNKEIGSAEIRKHNVIRIDDKYLYDGLVIASTILGRYVVCSCGEGPKPSKQLMNHRLFDNGQAITWSYQ